MAMTRKKTSLPLLDFLVEFAISKPWQLKSPELFPMFAVPPKFGGLSV